MDVANDFFNTLKGSLSEQTNSAMVGRIERFNASKMKADVLPLIRSSDGADPSMLIGVPVSMVRAGGFIIRPPYKKGDIVLVVFVDRDMENFLLSGKQSTPSTGRTHSLDDAVVIGSVIPFNQSLTGENTNDLLIAKEDMTSKIILKEDGDLVIEFDKDIKIKGKNIDIAADSQVSINGSGGVSIDGSSRSGSW